MWGNFKSYLGQTYVPNTQETEFRGNEDSTDDWVFVNISGEEIRKEEAEVKLLDDNQKQNRVPRLSPLPLLDISNTSSPDASPPLSPSKVEEGWLIAPPPCFTLNCPSAIIISPLEDLLIEHPSMSVYGRVPDFFMKDKKIKDLGEAEIKDVDIQDDLRTSSLPIEVSPDLEEDGCLKKLTVQSKSHPDLKAFFDQTENMKPAQNAKWESDQYKLCPSYINRQNRVHRYQSRKHHNQKKKSLARPFAEKCKHSF